MTQSRRCAHDLPFRAQECWCTAGSRWTNSATSATATRPTWARASRCPSTMAPTISTSSRFPLHLPRNCLKVQFERFPSHCELDELCRRVSIAYQPGHWAPQAFDTAIPHLEDDLWPGWRATACFLLKLHLNQLGATGYVKSKIVAIHLPLILLIWALSYFANISVTTLCSL